MDEYRIYRRISVDFTVPDLPAIREAAESLGGRPVLPFALLAKRYLTNFDARDEVGRPVPALTSEQNHLVALGILEGLASAVLEQNKGGPLAGDVRETLDEIVRIQDPAAARKLIDGFPKKAAVNNQRALLIGNQIFSSFMDDLATNFLLLLQVRAAPGERAVLKYSYEEQFRSTAKTGAMEELVIDRHTHRPPDRTNRFVSLFHLRPTPFMVRLPSLAMTQSFHIEVNAPDELLIASAALAAVHGNIAEVIDSQCGAQRAHLRAADQRRGTIGALIVSYSLYPSGLVTVMLLIAGITTLLLVAGLAGHAALGWHSSADATTAVLIVLPAIFASYLIRPGEHRLVRRLAMGYKWIAAALTAASFAVAAFMGVQAPTSLRPWVWFGGVVIAVVCTTLLVFSLRNARRCRDGKEPGLVST